MKKSRPELEAFIHEQTRNLKAPPSLLRNWLFASKEAVSWISLASRSGGSTVVRGSVPKVQYSSILNIDLT